MSEQDAEKYWITTDDGKTWKKVTVDLFINMEQACGFHGPGHRHGKPATAGFGGGLVKGHMHYGWIQEEQCDFGPCARTAA